MFAEGAVSFGSSCARLLAAPRGDLRVVAAEQHLRDGDTAERRRPGVGRVVETALAPRVCSGRFGVDRARDEPHGCVEEGHRGELAPGENELAERDLLDRIERPQPLVDPLVVAADQHQPVERGPRLGVCLPEDRAGGGGQDDAAPLAVRRPRQDAVEDPGQRLDAQHHPGAAAVRALVGPDAGLQRVEQVVHPYLDQSALDGPPDDREPDDRGEHLREERDDVDVQDPHVAFFDRLRRLIPGRRPSEPFARGAYELDRGRLDSAESAFAEALAASPPAVELATIRNKRAIVAIRRGERSRAIDELIAALEADPRCAAAITTVGNLLLEDGMIDDAIAHYEHALLLVVDYAPAYHNLGVALHRSGRRGESVRMLRKATRLEGRIKRS